MLHEKIVHIPYKRFCRPEFPLNPCFKYLGKVGFTTWSGTGTRDNQRTESYISISPMNKILSVFLCYHIDIGKVFHCQYQSECVVDEIKCIKRPSDARPYFDMVI